MVFKNVSYGLTEYVPKAIWDEQELSYNSDDDNQEDEFDPETWMDWNSEWLLNNYMRIRDFYESQYLRAPVSFNQYCEIILSQQ